MPKYVVTHGSVKLAGEDPKTAFKKVGTEIELTEEEAKRLEGFVTPAAQYQHIKAAEAEAKKPLTAAQRLAKAKKELAQLEAEAKAEADAKTKEGTK